MSQTKGAIVVNLVNVEQQWKQAVRDGDDSARRAAENEAAKSVPQIADRMARMSDDEAQKYANR